MAKRARKYTETRERHDKSRAEGRRLVVPGHVRLKFEDPIIHAAGLHHSRQTFTENSARAFIQVRAWSHLWHFNAKLERGGTSFRTRTRYNLRRPNVSRISEGIYRVVGKPSETFRTNSSRGFLAIFIDRPPEFIGEQNANCSLARNSLRRASWNLEWHAERREFHRCQNFSRMETGNREREWRRVRQCWSVNPRRQVVCRGAAAVSAANDFVIGLAESICQVVQTSPFQRKTNNVYLLSMYMIYIWKQPDLFVGPSRDWRGHDFA